MDNLTILIIDDDPHFIRPLELKFNKLGYGVKSVLSGKEAIHYVKKSPVDIALVDWQMPGMDGIETLIALKTLQPQLPVIMITAEESTKLCLEFMKAGGTNYIHKPVNFYHLQVDILHALQQKEQIKNATEQVFEVNKSLQDAKKLIASIQDRINNPLHAIKNLSQMGISKCEETNEDSLREYFEKIAGSAVRLNKEIGELINEKLDHNLTFDLESYDIFSLFKKKKP
ncbi:MAG: response regulator [Deltaproteobacteria bacterium]|nr:response regulator [Deltaproteobacteria bacterium]